MKDLVLGILGVVTGWIIWGYMTNDFSMGILFPLIYGLAIGFGIGKKEKVKGIKN
jgi:hypothetical protein